MANSFAYLTLILWPFVAWWLYRRMDIIPATFWTIAGGYLMLPVGVSFDFPLVPALNKETIPAIMAFIGCKYIAREDIKLLPSKSLDRTLILIFFFGSIITVLSNSEPITEIDRFLPGLSFKDIFSIAAGKYLLLLPFILTLQLVKTYEDQIQLLKLLVVAGLLYSVLIMFEIRMSPQLHKWLYGFFPHSWGQQVRYGGFRPVVFLGHGLWVSIFLVMVIGSSVALSKIKIKLTRFPDALVIGYLVLLLVLSKGFGSLILGMVTLSTIYFLQVRAVYMAALGIGLLAITYPFLCILEIFPHRYIIEQIELINAAQAGSLQFRFNHELILLERASEKILFGWGAWSRNRLVDSIVDGYWIGLLGSYGVVGFTTIFGLMFTTIWKAGSGLKLLVDENEKILLSGHCLMVALIMIDQIPNHSENPLFWVLIGALSGRQGHIRRELNKAPQASDKQSNVAGAP
ncbi:hypothetical protein N2488_09130 [SAR92 clade bacterium H231]|nr:hypothetical protein [SAR92 clade bacterium H231]